MTECTTLSTSASDGLQLSTLLWENKAVPPKAALLIVHGMTEMASRYQEFASYLCDNGVLVISFDLRGHGATSPNSVDRGFFAKKAGEDLLVSDVLQVRSHLDELLQTRGTPDLPVFLLGHSMGSMIASAVMKKTGGHGLAGLILSGLPECPGATKAGLGIAKLQSRLLGPRSEGKLLTKMAFGKNNARIHPLRTEKDWLTRDERIVDLYIASPDCMFLFKAAGFVTLLSLTLGTIEPNLLSDVVKSLPVLLIAGEADPVGGYGKAPQDMAARMKAAKMPVTLRLYPEARHEVLNETNRNEVFSDVLNFIATQREDPLARAMASGPGETSEPLS